MPGRIFVVVCAFAAATSARAAGPDARRVVATVNGQPITQAEVDLQRLLKRTGRAGTADDGEAIIDDLINRQLIRGFLNRKQIKAPEDLVDFQWQRLVDAAAEKRLDLPKMLQRIGYSEKDVKQDLALPVAWSAYVLQQTTDEQLRTFFDEHRRRFDGTTRHLRQIVLLVPTGAEESAWQAAEDKLTGIGQSISGGELKFEAAAKQFSQSPSAEQGGDLGFIHFHGDVPEPVAAAAFELELQKISRPVRSPYGVHLISVEEEQAGDLSLEDVRPDVQEERGRQEWNRLTAELRQQARIKRDATATSK